jgi:pimeloyl-ACP methyl ester carboxylesterase
MLSKYFSFIFLLNWMIPVITYHQHDRAFDYLQESSVITVVNRNGDEINDLIDGNKIVLNVSLDASVVANSPVSFEVEGAQVADCVIPAGKDVCSSVSIFSLGWFWNSANTNSPERTIRATMDGDLIASKVIQVKPRPVIMVHGFASSWEAWKNYLGPSGYLAQVGIPGYAVGDGQVEGIMNTGSLDNPQGQTNTIHQNAQILADYIQAVKQQTGAEMVDLLAHSMGGLISRDYIGSIMSDRDISQLIMLGSPMAGTDCASLPASLGLYLPATIEIRPSYVVEIFNQQVTERHGIAFHALAGDPIYDAFKSPCTSVPTDIAVPLSSVNAIPLSSVQMPILHQDLNTSKQVFDEFVFPLLRTSIDGFKAGEVNTQESHESVPLQFTKVYTGHLDPSEAEDVTIHIEDGVIVASFALYDTSRSLTVTVRGASGNVIDLTAEKNGLVLVNDPDSLFYLGYGFNNPKPGLWRVTLATTPDTPAIGAEYAITAYMVGGAVVTASADPIIPQVNTPVLLQAKMEINSDPITITSAQALIRKPDGNLLTVELTPEGNQVRASWTPDIAGLYAVDLKLTGNLSGDIKIDRTAFLSILTQPEDDNNLATRFFFFAIVVGVIVLILIIGFVILRVVFLKRR